MSATDSDPVAITACSPPQRPDSPEQPLPEEGLGLSGFDGVEDDGPETVSAQTQTTEAGDAAVQYELPGAEADPAVLAAQLASAELANFLYAASARCESALQQNELLDVLVDELAALADEEGTEGATAAGAGAGAAAAGARRSAAAGLTELYSFSDLMHSKGCTLTSVAWHPARRGVLAVACTQHKTAAAPSEHTSAPAATPASGSGNDTKMTGSLPRPGGQAFGAPLPASPFGASAPAPTGTPPASTHISHLEPGCILVWNHADTIHPELVLQPPAQALVLAFHPSPPHAWLAAGLSTGQVALFNLGQQQQQAAAGMGAEGAVPAAAPGGATSSKATEGGVERASRSAVLLPTYVSSPDACHQAPITDLQWLPGQVVTKDGRLDAAASAEGSASSAAGAESAAAPATPGACTLFATTAIDGSLLLWDMRISTRQRRAAKDEEAPEWRPALALGGASQPLMATRFCPDPHAGVGGFLLGSLEGEVAVAEVALVVQRDKGGGPEWALSTLQQAAGHTGRVLALCFSPFLSDTLLVVGDSGFVVWRRSAHRGGPSRGSSDGSPRGDQTALASKGGYLAVFESPFCADALYTCGCWSPSRPGVILLGRADGRLEAWDLLDRSHQAAMVATVAPNALTALATSPAPAGGSSGSSRARAQQLLAVGDSAGTLHLLELPRTLRRRGNSEVRTMAALLAAEQERLAEVARRAEERAALARAAADQVRAQAAAALVAAARQQPQATTVAKAGSQDSEVEDRETEGAAAERRYLALEAEWRERLLQGASGAGPAMGAIVDVGMPIPATVVSQH